MHYTALVTPRPTPDSQPASYVPNSLAFGLLYFWQRLNRNSLGEQVLWELEQTTAGRGGRGAAGGRRARAGGRPGAAVASL